MRVTPGEVWWARVNEERAVVVVLSTIEDDDARAIIVVPPAENPNEGVLVEVRLGAAEGLAAEGVVRVALPRPGFIPCQWLVTLSSEQLIERVGALSPEKLSEVDDLLRRGGLG